MSLEILKMGESGIAEFSQDYRVLWPHLHDNLDSGLSLMADQDSYSRKKKYPNAYWQVLEVCGDMLV